MKSITVGQLRQNPTAMLAEVEAGETYRITRHDREVGRIIPPDRSTVLLPPKAREGARTAGLARHELRTAESVEGLLDDMAGEW